MSKSTGGAYIDSYGCAVRESNGFSGQGDAPKQSVKESASVNREFRGSDTSGRHIDDFKQGIDNFPLVVGGSKGNILVAPMDRGATREKIEQS